MSKRLEVPIFFCVSPEVQKELKKLGAKTPRITRKDKLGWESPEEAARLMALTPEEFKGKEMGEGE